MKSCDDCVFHKEHWPDGIEKHICENSEIKTMIIVDLSIADTCIGFDDDSWVK